MATSPSLNPLDLHGRLADLANEIGDMTILDIGAGKCDSPISRQVLEIPCRALFSFDLHEPSLDILRTKPCAARRHIIMKVDALQSIAAMAPEIPDVALLLDVLEHLELSDAYELLRQLTNVVTRRILIWLPFGACPQWPYDGNVYQRHLSMWCPEMLEQYGFVVTVWKRFHLHISPPADAGWAVWDNPKRVARAV